MNEAEKKQAINWFCNCNYDLSTIAQHFGLTREQLKKVLNNEKR